MVSGTREVKNKSIIYIDYDKLSCNIYESTLDAIQDHSIITKSQITFIWIEYYPEDHTEASRPHFKVLTS